MNPAYSTLPALGILTVFAAVGWWLHRRGFFESGIDRALGVLSLDVALPCLVFSTLLDGFRPAEFHGWWILPLGWAGFTAAAALLSLGLARIANPLYRREFRLSLFYQNAIFIPVAMIAQIYGRSSREMVLLLLFTALFPAFFFGSYSFFFSGDRSGIRWHRVLHPVLFTTVLAVLLNVLGVGLRLPAFLADGIRQVGAMSVPLLLIMIGGRVRQDFLKQGRIQVREVLYFVLAKNVLFPLLALVILLALPVSREVAWLVLLQAAMPPVTAVPVVAERAGGNVELVNQYMIASFIVALVTIPLALGCFELLWHP